MRDIEKMERVSALVYERCDHDEGGEAGSDHVAYNYQSFIC